MCSVCPAHQRQHSQNIWYHLMRDKIRLQWWQPSQGAEGLNFKAIHSFKCSLTQNCTTERAPHFQSRMREIIGFCFSQRNKRARCCLGTGTKEVCALLAQAGPEQAGQKVTTGLTTAPTPRGVWDLTHRDERENLTPLTTSRDHSPSHCKAEGHWLG